MMTRQGCCCWEVELLFSEDLSEEEGPTPSTLPLTLLLLD